jgi:hypothetical protein
MKKYIKLGRFVLMGFAALATVAFLDLSKKETLELQSLTSPETAHADTPAQPVDNSIFSTDGGDGDGGGGGDDGAG